MSHSISKFGSQEFDTKEIVKGFQLPIYWFFSGILAVFIIHLLSRGIWMVAGLTLVPSVTIGMWKFRSHQLVVKLQKTHSYRQRYKTIQSQLEQKLEEFHSFMTYAPVVAWVMDAEGIVKYSNAAFVDLIGETQQAVVGQSIHDLFPDESAWEYRRNNEQVIKSGIVLETTESFPGGDGTVHHYLVRKFPIYQDKNKVCAGGIALDITERLQSHIKLEESKDKFQRLVDDIGEQLLVYSYSPDGKVTYVSNSFEAIFGFKKDLMIGQLWTELINWLPDDLDAVHARIHQYVNHEMETHQGEMCFIHPDHHHRTLRFSDHCVRDQSGQLIAIEGVLEDVTEQKKADAALHQVQQQLQARIDDLDRRNRDLVLLNEMSDFLQACSTQDEALEVLPKLLQALFQDCSGHVFGIAATHDRCESLSSWEIPGCSDCSEPKFSTSQCWALRRGQIHGVQPGDFDISCNHVHTTEKLAATLCVPIIAQSETLGLLFLATNVPEALSEAKQQLARTVAAQVGLALSNLQMRETLHYESMVDPLTGLYNRRVMNEMLNKSIEQAHQNHSSVGVIMLDIDHFKEFNDTYGHHAGDLVLRAIGTLLKQSVRQADVACRYGGEEMSLILVGSSSSETQRRAEDIRVAITQLNLSHQGVALGNPTASFGVACFPEHGLNSLELIESADVALYEAKKNGRNRVSVAHQCASVIHQCASVTHQCASVAHQRASVAHQCASVAHQ